MYLFVRLTVCFFISRYWTHFYVDPSDVIYYRWLFTIALAAPYNLVFIIARAVFEELQTR